MEVQAYGGADGAGRQGLMWTSDDSRGEAEEGNAPGRDATVDRVDMVDRGVDFPLLEIHRAVQTAVTWNTIFLPTNLGLTTPVSRTWTWFAGPQTSADWSEVMFEWDSSFVAFLSTIGKEQSKYLAYSNIIQLVKGRAAGGYLVDFFAGGKKNPGSSKPPVTAKVLLEVYRIYKDEWLVELLLPALMEWHRWFLLRRTAGGTETTDDGFGLLTLGAHKEFAEEPGVDPGTDWGEIGEARCESGADNSPMYDCAETNCTDLWDNSTHRMKLYDVGQSSLWVQDVEATAELCDILRAGSESDHADHGSDRGPRGRILRNSSLCNSSHLCGEDEHVYPLRGNAELVDRRMGGGL